MYHRRGWLNEVPSFAVCTGGRDFDWCREQEDLTQVVYQRCDCMDFCGTLSPKTPLRRYANMVPLLINTVGPKAAGDRLRNLNIWALVFILLSGGIGTLESQWPQEVVRNSIFNVLHMDSRVWIILFFEGDREERLLRKFHL